MTGPEVTKSDLDTAKRVLADLALSLAVSQTDDFTQTGGVDGGPNQVVRPSLLTIPEACSELRISRWSIYRLIQSNQLATVTIGRRRFVPKIALDDFIESLQRQGGQL